VHRRPIRGDLVQLRQGQDMYRQLTFSIVFLLLVCIFLIPAISVRARALGLALLIYLGWWPT
jgi:hypothetical protein